MIARFIVLDKTVDLIHELSSTPLQESIAPTKLFVIQVLKICQVNMPILVITYIYLDRLRNSTRNVTIPISQSQQSQYQTDNRQELILKCSRRMFFACICIAHKYLSEKCVPLRVWATGLGLPIADLHIAETALLLTLDHRMFVKMDEYQNFVTHLLS